MKFEDYLTEVKKGGRNPEIHAGHDEADIILSKHVNGRTEATHSRNRATTMCAIPTHKKEALHKDLTDAGFKHETNSAGHWHTYTKGHTQVDVADRATSDRHGGEGSTHHHVNIESHHKD